MQIGKHVIILPNSVISHDDIIDEYTCVASGVGISGNVTISQSCYLGVNCALISNITIGDNCLVDMGSVVLNNVEANSVVMSNPARFLRKTF